MLEKAKSVETVTPGIYRDAMAHLAGAVNIATTDGSAGRRGVTVAAAMSVSDSPATIVVCLNRNRDENLWFRENGNLALNTLCASQIELSRIFAGEDHLAMDKRFAAAQWQSLVTGAPVLLGARTALDCRIVEFRPVETHWMILARVVAVAKPVDETALVYMDRGYREL
ncbi:MAG: flavin reductase family protein [Rhizobiaceae bacterium]